ncbi:MAG: enoyl-CoA hydratase/isomerase family protein [Alphaproteobacteria bacterium]|nr:enoyl-CoA hydratase/isomerase family protein [Alphaproteobacteria bacterium]
MSDTFGNGTVLLAVDGRGVATVTLNRPERNNAYNDDVIGGLLDAFGRLDGDDAVRVVVIRGNGKHFQAGADLAWLKEIGKLSPEQNVAVSARTMAAIQGLTEFPKPTVALIHGGCFGGGTGIVAAVDIAIASRDAIFAITEARWGVMAGIIIPHLNAAIGVRNVRRWALSCERFGAEQAKEMGLVHQVCEVGALDAAAAPIIDGLLLSAPEAVMQTKHRALIEAGLLLGEGHIDALVREHAAKRPSEEAVEGLASFLEKRHPSWYPGG